VINGLFAAVIPETLSHTAVLNASVTPRISRTMKSDFVLFVRTRERPEWHEGKYHHKRVFLISDLSHRLPAGTVWLQDLNKKSPEGLDGPPYTSDANGLDCGGRQPLSEHSERSGW